MFLKAIAMPESLVSRGPTYPLNLGEAQYLPPPPRFPSFHLASFLNSTIHNKFFKLPAFTAEFKYILLNSFFLCSLYILLLVHVVVMYSITQIVSNKLIRMQYDKHLIDHINISQLSFLKQYGDFLSH